jgi:uncharacterized protein
MAKKLFKRWIPEPAFFREHKSLQFLGHLLHDPNLFHLNRHSVSGAFFVGLFTAFLPTLGQMPIAAVLALFCRVNMPISVALVWISNPLTMPAIFYATFEFGQWLLKSPPIKFSMEMSWEWFSSEFPHLWQPLLLGSLIIGVIMGAVGYLAMQVFWRWQVLRHWEQRKADRLAKRRLQEIDENLDSDK